MSKYCMNLSLVVETWGGWHTIPGLSCSPQQLGTAMPAQPEITVIIAAWNAEAFLGKAVASACAQKGVALEVIVANDASTDDTAGLTRRLATEDPRIRLVENPVNQGPAAARNRAISAARGEWIAVLDADDTFLPGRLARMLAFARAREADLVFDLFQEATETGAILGTPLRDTLQIEEHWDLARWITDNLPGRRELGTGYLKPLIRRAILEDRGLRYRETLRNSEDYALVTELLAAGGTIWLLPEAGYVYTRREGSISHRVGPRHLEPLLHFDLTFAKNLEQAGHPSHALQRRRIEGLRNSLAVARMIEALKARKPLMAAGALAARPQALGQAASWVSEVLSKRLGFNTHV